MVVALTRAIADQVVAILNEVIATGDGRAPTLWKRDAPSGVGWQGTPGQAPFVAYAAVYPLPGQSFDGSLADAASDVWWSCQVTSVGATRAQAETVADLVRAQMVPSTLAIAGCWRAFPDGGGGIRRDDAEQPPLFYSVDLYKLHIVSTV